MATILHIGHADKFRGNVCFVHQFVGEFARPVWFVKRDNVVIARFIPFHIVLNICTIVPHFEGKVNSNRVFSLLRGYIYGLPTVICVFQEGNNPRVLPRAVFPVTVRAAAQGRIPFGNGRAELLTAHPRAVEHTGNLDQGGRAVNAAVRSASRSFTGQDTVGLTREGTRTVWCSSWMRMVRARGCGRPTGWQVGVWAGEDRLAGLGICD